MQYKLIAIPFFLLFISFSFSLSDDLKNKIDKQLEFVSFSSTNLVERKKTDSSEMNIQEDDSVNEAAGPLNKQKKDSSKVISFSSQKTLGWSSYSVILP